MAGVTLPRALFDQTPGTRGIGPLTPGRYSAAPVETDPAKPTSQAPCIAGDVDQRAKRDLALQRDLGPAGDAGHGDPVCRRSGRARETGRARWSSTHGNSSPLAAPAVRHIHRPPTGVRGRPGFSDELQRPPAGTRPPDSDENSPAPARAEAAPSPWAPPSAQTNIKAADGGSLNRQD